jgi:hypothetical protein
VKERDYQKDTDIDGKTALERIWQNSVGRVRKVWHYLMWNRRYDVNMVMYIRITHNARNVLSGLATTRLPGRVKQKRRVTPHRLPVP